MSRPESAKTIEDIAKFIVDEKLDCEVFNPNNLRFITLDKSRGLPTLYFEDKSGNKGRIRQSHAKGPLIAFSGNIIRGFFPKGVKNWKERFRIISRAKLRQEKNFAFSIDEETGDEFVTPFSFDEVSEAVMSGVLSGRELLEYCAETKLQHHSGGAVMAIKDSDDRLVNMVNNFKGRLGGRHVIAAAISLWHCRKPNPRNSSKFL